MIGRILGVIRRPRATFETVIAVPRWSGLLALLFVLNFGTNAAFFATDVGRQALVDHWERTALAFGQDVGDARYAEFQELSRRGATYAAVMALAEGPVAAFVLAALLLAGFTMIGSPASYRQVLAVVVYAGVILMVREVVAAPLNYARESIASPTTLAQLFPAANAAAPLARFFTMIDVFIVWWLTVLAIGLSVLYRRRAWRIAAALYGVYLGVAVAMAVTMAMLGGTI